MKDDMIKDKTDPRKVGMFSSLGRFTTEIYPIILKSDEIINDKRRLFKVKEFDFSEDSSEEEIKKVISNKILSKVDVVKKEESPEIKAELKKASLSAQQFRPMNYIKINMDTPPPTRYRPKNFKL